MGIMKVAGSLFSTGASVLKTVVNGGSTALGFAKKVLSSKVTKTLGGAALGFTAINVLANSGAGKASAEAAKTNTPAMASASAGSTSFFDSIKKSFENIISGGASLLKNIAGKTKEAAQNIFGKATEASTQNDAKEEKITTTPAATTPENTTPETTAPATTTPATTTPAEPTTEAAGPEIG